jgi:radical SAM-linked protein
MRLRITFAKTDAMRYTGHLDTQRTWERTLRRARLPLAYSQGFNPHPKINLGSALPLGFTSQGEMIEVWLEEQVPLRDIGPTLTPILPPGLNVKDIQETEIKLPKLQNLIQSTKYRIEFIEPVPKLESRVAALLKRA